MKAGRELDALIAEKVMGWKGINSHAAHLEVGQFYNRQDGVVIVEHRNRLRMFEPSTSIADAWLVAEKLNEKWGNWALIFRGTWAVYEYPNDYGEYPPDAEADTAPLAICLAALKAVGVDVPAADSGIDRTGP
jgi:hypothetical protein